MKRPMRGWRLLLFARCDDASHADSDEWDGPIDVDRWWAARLHRLGCGPCRRRHRRMQWLRRLLTGRADGEHPPMVELGTVLSAAAAEKMRARLASAVEEDGSGFSSDSV